MRILGVVLGLASGVVAAGACLASLGCCASREVLQSGLVPLSEPLPPPTSHGAGDVYVGASGLTYLEPSSGAETLGHHVPAAQLQLIGSLRPIAGITIRPVGLLAIPTGASPIAPGLLPVPDAPSFGAGWDVGYTIGDEDEPFLLRPHVGVLVHGIAIRVQDPAGGQTLSDLGWMAVIEGGVDVGYWLTPWLLVQGSIDARNAPEVPRSVVACFGNDPPFARFGGLVVSARVSAEIEVTRGLGIVAAVGAPVYGSPYASYPILSLGLRTTFGDGRTGIRRRRDAAPAPQEDYGPSVDDAMRAASPGWTIDTIAP